MKAQLDAPMGYLQTGGYPQATGDRVETADIQRAMRSALSIASTI
jgi:hypothetical protein